MTTIYTRYEDYQADRKRKPPAFNPRGHLDTLAAAREHVVEYLPTSEGVPCPCCGQPCRLHPDALNRQIVIPLIWMCRSYQENERWIHMQTEAPRSVIRGNKYGLLRWWQLVEEAPNVDPTKKHTGDWRPLELAFRFIAGLVALPKHVFLFNDNYYGCSQDVLVTVTDTLEDVWEYKAFMALSAGQLGAHIEKLQLGSTRGNRRVHAPLPQAVPVKDKPS